MHNEPFRYTSYDAGSLRLATVEALLRPGNPAINIVEWRNLKLEGNPTLTVNRPSYAAISHVWKATKEVERLSSLANQPFEIDIGNGNHYTGSWHGLVQAARLPSISIAIICGWICCALIKLPPTINDSKYKTCQISTRMPKLCW
jgi:hypothetical protein